MWKSQLEQNHHEDFHRAVRTQQPLRAAHSVSYLRHRSALENWDERPFHLKDGRIKIGRSELFRDVVLMKKLRGRKNTQI